MAEYLLIILSLGLAVVLLAMTWYFLKREKIRKRECSDLKEQLKQAYKMEATGRLAGGVAHDFNNMLAGICGAAECLNIKLDERPELKKYSQIIINSCEQATQLTSQLMMFSCQKEPEVKIIDLGECVDEGLYLLEHGIGRNIEIVRALSSRPLPVRISCEQVQSLLLNLGFNSRDAMSDVGQITVKLRRRELSEVDMEAMVLSTIPGEYAEIEFADNGSGIKPEIMDKIFEPFFTTKGTEKGTGLGLPAVYGIMRCSGGTIGVENREKGVAFHLYFPLALSAEVHEKAATKQRHLEAKILVADDDVVFQKLMADILRHAGCEVYTASDAVQVIQVYRENGPFDAVMLDVMMPRGRGTDVYKKLKVLDTRLKTIFLSGYAEDEEIKKILKSDRYTAFLLKPCRADKLIKTLEMLLAKAQEA